MSDNITSQVLCTIINLVFSFESCEVVIILLVVNFKWEYLTISCKSSLVCIIAPPPTQQQQMCDHVWCSWSPRVMCVIWNMTIVGSGHDVGSVTQHLFTLHANPLSLVDYFTFALKEDHETYLNIFKSMVCLIIYKSTCFTVVIKLQCITAYLET